MAEDGPLRSEVKIAGLTLDQWNWREIEAPDFGDERHCEECTICGPMTRRYLGDLLYHSSRHPHRPLAGSTDFRFVPVDETDEKLSRWGE